MQLTRPILRRDHRIPSWLAVHRGVALVTLAFAVLSAVYSFVTPAFEAPDEDFHYAVVRHIAQTGRLPRVQPGETGAWAQEGTQAPLYYLVGAAATSWIDTTGEVARFNPHAALGQPGAPDNKNRVAHAPAEGFPWQGNLLALHILRLLGVLMGAATVSLTYALALTVWPGSRPAALFAAALVAFNPQFAFISGSVNNDTLTALLGAWLLWLAARTVQDGLTTRRGMTLAVVTGLALLTKLSALSFLPLVAGAILLDGWRRRDWRRALLTLGAVATASALLAGWWYARNLALYGDPTALSAHLDVMPRRDITLLGLRHEWQGLWMSYWALFGWFNVPAESWVYALYGLLSGVAVLGLLRWLVATARSRDWPRLLLPALLAAQVVLTLASLVRWSLLTYGSQGRLLFHVAPAIAALMAWGVLSLLPAAWRPRAVPALAALMLAIAALLPARTIAPAYARPVYAGVTPAGPPVEFGPAGAGQPALRLLGVDIAADSAAPGDTVLVTAEWEALAPLDRDWSVFVHLVDSAELIAGQYDSYPGGGLIATSQLAAGDRWTDAYHVEIDETAYSPETLTARLGIYDYRSGERMALGDGADSVQVGRVALRATSGEHDLPNAISVDFGGEMALLGYTVDDRTPHPGDTISLSLHWQGLQPMSRDYTVSVQVLGETDLRNIGQKDSWPLDGALPTTRWAPGEILRDTIPITLAGDAPPGVYDVQIVVYWIDEQGALQRLTRLGERGEPLGDAVQLTQVRVAP